LTVAIGTYSMVFAQSLREVPGADLVQLPQWNASNTVHIDDVGRNFALNP